MTPPEQRHAAELRVADARRRFNETLTALQTKLSPGKVARDAVDGLADSGTRALDAGVASAKRNPAAAAGAATLVVAWFGRRRIVGLFRRPAAAPDPALPINERAAIASQGQTA